jgi:prolyl 4-hydroxylase
LNQLFWQPQHPLQENKKLKLVHKSPNVFVMDDFLTLSELSYCETLFETNKFSKSFVDTNDNQSIYKEEQRTSSFSSVGKLQNAHVASIERRASHLLGLTVEQMEPLQLVRYRVGEFFGIHHDLGILFDDGSVELPPRNHWTKRRMVTIFVYLNDSDGCTYFPLLGGKDGLRVTPKRGRAVLFCNILQNGMPDPKTVHAGEPPTVGMKYGLNIWACEI